MPHVTFIYPSIGRFARQKYIRSWQMQPLSVAALAHLTPPSWERSFFDDRLEAIDFDQPTDLAAISIETFTARRGYQIAAEYRKRNIPVVMGGYHATFRTQEALEHADAVCVGEAEGVWASMLSDAEAGILQKRYAQPQQEKTPLAGYDRSIFKGKKYFKIALVETGRGCCFKCRFCSITAFHAGRVKNRAIADVVQEVRALKEKAIFIVDDNIAADLKRARELFTAFCGLKLQWVGQASINITKDPKLLDLMVKSGCVGLLIGFESLDETCLSCVDKQVNRHVDYSAALARLRRRGIVVYGTFMMGLPTDSMHSMARAAAFAIDEKIFIAAFNHVVPFPGTPLHDQLAKENRMLYDRWWLNEEYRFGDVPFKAECGSPVYVKEACHTARRRFYSLPSIMKRSMDMRGNCGSLRRLGLYFGLNFLLRREISQKRGLPLGLRE